MSAGPFMCHFYVPAGEIIVELSNQNIFMTIDGFSLCIEIEDEKFVMSDGDHFMLNLFYDRSGEMTIVIAGDN